MKQQVSQIQSLMVNQKYLNRGGKHEDGRPGLPSTAYPHYQDLDKSGILWEDHSPSANLNATSLPGGLKSKQHCYNGVITLWVLKRMWKSKICLGAKFCLISSTVLFFSNLEEPGLPDQ